MTFSIRPYQQRVLDQLHGWWMKHPELTDIPICVMPTGSGKSVVIAALVRGLFEQWPAEHPRTVVLVPSKELAEQNAEKLCSMLPPHISVGYYSASLGRKVPDADVIVATIGSIYDDSHLLGLVRCVVIDECHGVNPSGAEAGRYRKFLTALGTLCQFRVVGFTATPFRGDGVWLTDGESPLFSGIAANVTVQELLSAGFLAPLVRPIDAVATRIDTSGIKTTSGDYNMGELSERVDAYLPAAAAEAVQLAADRRKWIAFTATVANAQALVTLLQGHGIATALVCGDTPAQERADLIADFRAGRLRCLVTVLALATGFDVPDVDCILWLRPTKSPVLYVQGAGRGLRIAPGKTDCLWCDFSDTTERLGPVDAIKGKKKKEKGNRQAPCIVCDECGARVVPASTIICPECGHQMRELEPDKARPVSQAAIMASQVQTQILTYPVTRVSYAVHRKPGSPDSLRVDYYSGLRRVASEWVCVEHTGYPKEKARAWWRRFVVASSVIDMPETAKELCSLVNEEHTAALQSRDVSYIKVPKTVRVNEGGKWPEVVGYEWYESHEDFRAGKRQEAFA